MQGPISDEDLRKAVRALAAHDGNASAAARSLDMDRSTFSRRVTKATLKGFVIEPEETEIEFPEFPEEEMPTDDLIAHMKDRFSRRWAADQARDWAEIKVKDDRPIGICWFGDPHVDNDGCNWPLLEEHAHICRDTPGLYGANIGDTTDNWVGRLSRLYAHSGTSRNTAVRLAEIFISEMGINWLLLLRGNHDMWSQSRSDDPLTWISKGTPAPLEDWRFKFKLVFKNGREVPIHASHSFSGQSWFHPLHGGLRAALEEGIAHLYISGHTHEFGVMHWAAPKRNTSYVIAKARGYKWIDHHALVLGHDGYQDGAAIVTIIDPKAKNPNPVVHTSCDVAAAARYLTVLRSG